jgi:hypothetical protein
MRLDWLSLKQNFQYISDAPICVNDPVAVLIRTFDRPMSGELDGPVAPNTRACHQKRDTSKESQMFHFKEEIMSVVVVACRT